MKRREFLKLASATMATLAAAPSKGITLTGTSSITVRQGESVSATLQLSQKGKPQATTFAVLGLPSGLTAKFSPSSCRSGCQTGLTISAAANAATGQFNLTIRAQSGSDT